MKLSGFSTNLPKTDSISQARNLPDIIISPGVATISEFIGLRETFKKNGRRNEERAITAALKRMEARESSWYEQMLLLLAFDLTAEYGASPWRPLLLILVLIFLFSIPYFFALTRAGDGIWKAWPKDRIQKDAGQDHPVCLSLSWSRAIFAAIYFSIISATSIGWRDINIGSWISKVQPSEYTLHATGWVRSVSGIQSLISVYLIAIWALCYFGRPFE